MVSGGCLGGVWGVSARCQGRLVVSGGVRRCFGGALDTFSDLGTLGPPPGHTGILDPGSDRVKFKGLNE